MAIAPGGVSTAATASLITGGAGFIGCNLADRLLRSGARVVVLDDFSRPGSRLNADWLRQRHAGDLLTVVEGDVGDEGLMRSVTTEVDVVFHLAAQVAVTTSISNPRADFDANLAGTLNVLEAARASRPAPIVIFSSTNKVYGGLEEQSVVESETRYVMPELPAGVPETAPLSFNSPYACSKGAADQYVLAYAQIYDLPAVVFRQSCIYGPRQMGMEDQGWVAWFLLAGKLGIPATIYGSGKQVRDLLYVDDLIDAFLAAVAAPERASGRAYNIGGGPEFALSIWHEFSALASELGLRLPVTTFAPERPGDQRVYISDNSRVGADLGWRPKVSPSQGIAEIAEWVAEAGPSVSALLTA